MPLSFGAAGRSGCAVVALLGGAAAAAALLLECRDPTEVTLEITSDVPCDTLRRMGTTVTAGGVATEVETRSPAATGYDCTTTPDGSSLGTIVVVPSGGKHDHFSVRVTTGVRRSADQCAPREQGAPDYSGCIVARRALAFLPNTPLHLAIEMRQDCLDKPCDPTSTCANGACVSSDIDPSTCVTGCGEDVVDASPRDAGADAPLDAEADAACVAANVAPDCGRVTAGIACYASADASISSGGACGAMCCGTSPFCCNSPANGGVRCQIAQCTSPGEYTFTCDEPTDCNGGDLCIANGHAGVDGGAFCLPPAQACSGVQVCQADCDCPSGQACPPPHLCPIAGEALPIWIRTCGGVCP